MSESTVKQDRKERDKALAEAVASSIVLLATAQRAHPEATVVFETLRLTLGQITSLALGPDWLEKNEKRVDEAIGTHMARIQEAVDQQTQAANVVN